MNFDEAIKELKYSYRPEYAVIPRDFAIDIIEQLRTEYEPTIKMSLDEYDVLFDYVKEIDVDVATLLTDVKRWRQRRVGNEELLFDTLSLEELEQAYNHPGSVEVANEEEN